MVKLTIVVRNRRFPPTKLASPTQIRMLEPRMSQRCVFSIWWLESRSMLRRRHRIQAWAHQPPEPLSYHHHALFFDIFPPTGQTLQVSISSRGEKSTEDDKSSQQFVRERHCDPRAGSLHRFLPRDRWSLPSAASDGTTEVLQLGYISRRGYRRKGARARWSWVCKVWAFSADAQGCTTDRCKDGPHALASDKWNRARNAFTVIIRSLWCLVYGGGDECEH